MRKKTITINCSGCELCQVNDNGSFLCTWGTKKPKVMFPAKGKQVIVCNLKKERT